MLTPAQTEELPIELEKQFRDLEQRVMSDVVRRLKLNGNDITRSADWQINRLIELGKSQEEIKQYLSNALKMSNNEIEKAYQKVIDEGYAQNEEIYKQADKDFIPYEDNQELQQLVSATKEQTQGEFKNITQSLGFATKDAVGNIKFQPLADYYQKTLDSAMLDIATGMFSYNTVLNRVVTEMTNSGLRTVDYASGWSNRVDVAARRAIMTGITQVTAKVNEDTAKDLGTNTFEVSYHSGARPSHAEWQGGIYTYEELETVCGLGSGEGLCGWNCYHSYSPFIPGISEPAYTKQELARMKAEDAKPVDYYGKKYTKYEALQKQRTFETRMRAQREKIKLLEEGGADEDSIITARAKYRVTSSQYAQFSKAMNLPQQRDRIYQDGKGGIGKGKWKTNTAKSVAKSQKSGIINKKRQITESNKLDVSKKVIMPNAITATTSQRKLQEYLLNSNHPVGKHKARVLNSILGYNYQNWDVLSDEIFNAIQTTGVSNISKTKYGTKYIIPVWVNGNKGKSMLLKTVWQVDNDSNIPRMITVTFNKKNVR